MNIAAVDADAHGDLGGRYGVQGFPTIKVFGSNKNSPTDYSGTYSSQFIDKLISLGLYKYIQWK